MPEVVSALTLTGFSHDRMTSSHVATQYSVCGCGPPRTKVFCTQSMCKHILNAQVSIRAPCCKQWFDCSECHAETQTHQLTRTTEMAFICKKCKKAFRKDMTVYEESDEYCPHCDNHYVIDAKTPQAAIGVEGEDARMDARLLKDERMESNTSRSLFRQDISDRLG